MICIERNPSIFEAIQFNQEGDHTFVKRGYSRSYNGISPQLFATDNLPRSPECKFAWVLSSPYNFEEVKIGDWLVAKNNNPKLKIYSNEEFQAKFVRRELPQ